MQHTTYRHIAFPLPQHIDSTPPLWPTPAPTFAALPRPGNGSWLPAAGEAWRQTLADGLARQVRAARAAGLRVLVHTDLLVLPPGPLAPVGSVRFCSAEAGPVNPLGRAILPLGCGRNEASQIMVAILFHSEMRWCEANGVVLGKSCRALPARLLVEPTISGTQKFRKILK